MASRERLRLERLLSDQEDLFKEAFVAFLRDARSDTVMAEVSDRLERRDLEGALRIVDSYVIRLSTVVPRAFQRAARLEMEGQASLLQPLVGAVAIGFDPGDRRAADLMRRSQLTFVREFGQEQRRATTLALGEALASGEGLRSAARAFRDSIGLTEHQERVVRNYRRLLESRSAQALDRDLRDRRFDPTIRGAIERDEPMTTKQIDRMTERYRERYLMLRAETIARTEGLRVTGIARKEAFRQVVEDTGIDRSQIRRVWNATQDARTRDSHAAMDGQEVGLDEPFTSGAGHRLMFPGDPQAPPEEVIQCRCVVTNRVL